MSKRLDAAPRKQARRVAAWIYVVINPIIDSLQREVSLLEFGNLAWRPFSHRSEIIKPIQEYVDSTQWPNYQTFLAEHPKSVFIPAFKQHDSALEALNNAADVLFSRLLDWPEFLSSLRTALNRYEHQRTSLGPRAQPLSESDNGFREEVAQHVINNSQVLPSHYVISMFWNSEGISLLAFRDRPEFGPISQAKDVLLGTSRRVKQVLESYRLTLSRDYDVPAAPVPGLGFDE